MSHVTFVKSGSSGNRFFSVNLPGNYLDRLINIDTVALFPYLENESPWARMGVLEDRLDSADLRPIVSHEVVGENLLRVTYDPSEAQSEEGILKLIESALLRK